MIQKHICTTIRLISKDLEFSCVFFDLCKELVGECLPTRRPTQKLIIPGSTVISFQMIFEALQFEHFGFNFHSLSSKILKIPEFNVIIRFLAVFRSIYCLNMNEKDIISNIISKTRITTSTQMQNLCFGFNLPHSK